MPSRTDVRLNVLVHALPDPNGKLVSVVWLTRSLLNMLEIIQQEGLGIRLHCLIEPEFVDLDHTWNQQLQDEGLELHALPQNPGGDSSRRQAARCLRGQWHYPFLALRERRALRAIGYFAKRYEFLRQLVSPGEPWLIHSHTPDFGMEEVLALRKSRGVPVMLTFHGEGQRRMMDGEKRAYWDPKYERRYRRLLPHLDRVVFISEDYRNNMSYLGIPREKTRVVHNGVAPDEFFPLAGEPQAGPLRVLCFSDLDARPLRGLHYVIAAAPEIVRAHPAIRFTVLFGRNSRQYVDNVGSSPMGRLAAELGVAEHFEFVPWVEPGEMNRFVNEHDLLLHPTFADTCSNFILEGMACGKPVIASRGCANDEFVSEENGILVDYSSLRQDIVRAVLQLAGSPQLRAQLGAAGKRRVIAYFNRQRQSRDYLALYREWGA